MTPLLQAAGDGALDIVKYLAENGANVNAGDKDGLTPLMAAEGKGHPDVAEFLKR
jgi:ankyrin repeat protein